MFMEDGAGVRGHGDTVGMRARGPTPGPCWALPLLPAAKGTHAEPIRLSLQ